MPDALKKLYELQAVMILAQRAARDGDAAYTARVIQEMHIQTGLLLSELRKPTMPSAKIYDLSAERRTRVWAMLQQAHEAMEKMSAVAAAVKDERWGDAERGVSELRTLLDAMSNGIGEKVRETIGAPQPDRRDRG